MGFDDIPEDYHPSYPCDVPGCEGSVVIAGNEADVWQFWQCDTCEKVYGDVER